MKRPVWPRAGLGAAKAAQPGDRSAVALEDDPVRAVLIDLAAGIEARVRSVLQGRADATTTLPARGAWSAPSGGEGRVWRSDCGDGVDVWCTLDDDAARALLEVVLCGPAAARPTALERAIVKETVERFLVSGDRLWEEEARCRPPEARIWRCEISISSPPTLVAKLALVAPVLVPPAPPAARVDVRHVPLPLSATLTPVGMQLSEIMGWRSGAIVALDRGGAVVVRLSAGATIVATGRLGSSLGRRAIRIGPVDVEAHA